VLLRVAECCNVMQYVAVCCKLFCRRPCKLSHAHAHTRTRTHTHTHARTRKHAHKRSHELCVQPTSQRECAFRYKRGSVLQCVAVCCSILKCCVCAFLCTNCREHHVYTCRGGARGHRECLNCNTLQHTASRCNVLQLTTTHCNTH